MKRARNYSTAYLEAVAILSSWSGKAGAFEVRPQCAADGNRLIARNAKGDPVGALTWSPRCDKLHVVVGFGSWQVSTVCSWTCEELDRDALAAHKAGNYHIVHPQTLGAQETPHNQRQGSLGLVVMS